MLRLTVLVFAVSFATLAAAKDCTPVETAPGVKTKPSGCADLGRELAPKKADDGRLKGADGYIITEGGTKLRIHGKVGYEMGVGTGKR